MFYLELKGSTGLGQDGYTWGNEYQVSRKGEKRTGRWGTLLEKWEGQTKGVVGAGGDLLIGEC